ncbi:CDP-alcohol phosphatidyltransferase-domain-containing protein [Schizophyllum amplum]|uniref:CDP-diacylglycerol--inositol 3-phosphatidyltransferase n=1 Tax=Schizophyllum amplum TaxID=97359 RepID=A0A550CAS0_9AGAR|nr:CDP-alcohol phosphatidyltransferase-domain-containing protein [Auriculariopsis ampla]
MALRHRRGDIEVTNASIAVDLVTKKTYEENVFLFVPNLIGYTRVILAAVSLHFMSYHPKYCTVAYIISALLDAVDGWAARAKGQSSKFGAVLDMVTDRCATSCLLCYLTSAYPEYALVFQFLIALDFSSHYMHMYSSLATGNSSHKTVQSSVSRILSLYYSSVSISHHAPTCARSHLPDFLFIICAGNELFFVALYLIKWVHTPIGLGYHPSLPFAAVLAHLTWPELVALLSFPICALKNVINVVQLWKGSKILVSIDLLERAEKHFEAEKKKEKLGKA